MAARKPAPQDPYDYQLNGVHFTNDVFRYDFYNQHPPRTEFFQSLIRLVSQYDVVGDPVRFSRTITGTYQSKFCTITTEILVTSAGKCRLTVNWSFQPNVVLSVVGYPYRYQDLVNVIELVNNGRDNCTINGARAIAKTIYDRTIIRNPIVTLAVDNCQPERL